MTNEEAKAAHEWHAGLVKILEAIPSDKRDAALATARSSVEHAERLARVKRMFGMMRLEDQERLVEIDERDIDKFLELGRLRRERSDFVAFLRAFTQDMRGPFHMAEAALPRLLEEAEKLLAEASR